MPAEIIIYLSADHVRAGESCRGIRGVAQQNYSSSDYLSQLTPPSLVPLLFPSQSPPPPTQTIQAHKYDCCGTDISSKTICAKEAAAFCHTALPIADISLYIPPFHRFAAPICCFFSSVRAFVQHWWRHTLTNWLL